MEVVILCGGKGTRMRDVTADVPKPMVPIGDKPILWHIMKHYAAYGHKKFVLCLGYKSWMIKQYFLNYYLAEHDLTVRLDAPESVAVRSSKQQGEDWEVTLAETGAESMTAYRIRSVEQYIRGDDFMVTYGDGVADVDLDALLKFHRSHGKLGTVTAVRPPSRFGELGIDGNTVTRFIEKPQVSKGSINGGFFIFRREFFRRLVDDPTIMLESGPLAELSSAGQLMAFEHDGYWQPIDNGRDYQHVNELWNSGRAPWKTWEQQAHPRLVA